jgi:transcription initiation factor TFIIIB Brf1 subunit/transcription initiation factor TFIIB
MNADDLEFAVDRVAGICNELGLSNECQQEAERFAREADLRWPVNRAPSVVAASAVYLAAALVNEKQTQHTVADAAGCSTVSIREGYQELAEHDDITLERTRSGRRNDFDRFHIMRRGADFLGGLRD